MEINVFSSTSSKSTIHAILPFESTVNFCSFQFAAPLYCTMRLFIILFFISEVLFAIMDYMSQFYEKFSTSPLIGHTFIDIFVPT